MDNVNVASFTTLTNAVNNTLSYANSGIFYAFVPTAYKDYYFKIVRTALQWLDGYVPDFHSPTNGIGSSRLATSIVENLASKIKGTSFVFRSKNNDPKNKKIARDFTDDYQYSANFDKAIYKAIAWHLASGTSFLKVNFKNGDIWLDACRQDTLLYTSSFRGDIIDAKMVIKDYVMENANHEGNKQDGDKYVLVEHRYFKKINKDDLKDKKKIILKTRNGKKFIVEQDMEVPVVRYEIYRSQGFTLNNMMTSVINEQPRQMNWAEIDGKFKDMFKRDYPSLRVGEEQILPLKDSIGVYSLKHKQADVSITSADFGSSILNRAQYYLMVYDYAWSLRLRDLYLGKGTVLTPKKFSIPDRGVDDSDISSAPQTLGGVLDNVSYETYDTSDESQKPQPVQFNIRNDEWENVLNDCIRKIAISIGISPKIIAPDVMGSLASRKTAVEVEEENERTDDFINDARQDVSSAMSKLMEDVLLYLGYERDAITFSFQKISANTKERVQARVLEQYNNGLIDTREALSQLYPEADENRLDDMVKRAELQQMENLKKRESMLSPSMPLSFDDSDEL